MNCYSWTSYFQTRVVQPEKTLAKSTIADDGNGDTPSERRDSLLNWSDTTRLLHLLFPMIDRK
jgi:hypothetical protein